MSRRSCRRTCHLGWRVLAGREQQQPPGGRERWQPPGGHERLARRGAGDGACLPIFGGYGRGAMEGGDVFDSLILQGQGGMEINTLSPPVILNFYAPLPC